jgi:hypothetical protein
MRIINDNPILVCTEPPPQWDTCDTPVCDTDCKVSVCPPKTRLNTCIKVKQGVTELSFLVATSVCDTTAIQANLHCWEIAVRVRGKCDVLTKLKPNRAEDSGRMWCTIPDVMWVKGGTHYELDVYMDDKLILVQCITVTGVLPYGLSVGYNNPVVTKPTCSPPIINKINTEDCNVEC